MWLLSVNPWLMELSKTSTNDTQYTLQNLILDEHVLRVIPPAICVYLYRTKNLKCELIDLCREITKRIHYYT